jgi:hypothetical protein
MQLLRRLVRFWFGIQALSCVTSILALATVLLMPYYVTAPDSESLHQLAGASLGWMALFDGVSGIAWWMLRKGKPSARGWAIVASVMNAPLPMLSHLPVSNVIAKLLHVPQWLPAAAITVAGLVAFWPEDSTAPAATPKPAPATSVRVAGDGTSQLKDWTAQGVSIAIIWLAFNIWSRWATAHDLHYPGFLAFLIQMECAVLLTTFGHELGHLVAGWAGRKKLRSFHVGPFRWAIRNGEWRFDFNLLKFYGGSVGMVAPDLRNVRSRKAFSLIGGPVASLVMGSIFIVVAMLTPGRPWQNYWMFFSMLATFSISAFIVNLIPLKPESLYSDGAQLYQIVTNGPWARVHFAFAMVTTSLVSRVRPRDFDVNVIRSAADSVPTGERGLLLRMFACMHYADANRIPEAVAWMEKAEPLYEGSVFQKPQDLCAEFVFVNALYKRDLLAAERWWKRIDALPKPEQDADYWRAQTALHWLRGEREEARNSWARGNALAQKLPASGTYEFTRSCFAKLAAALDEPVRTTPPPLEVAAAPELVAV